MTHVTCGEASVCRIGFVGTGGVADRHASVLAGFDDVELVAATDPDSARASTFAVTHGLRAVPDIAALVDADLHAVYVCVPPYAHGAPETELAAAGVALFVEKPLAADEATAERVGRVLTDRQVPTRVGHHWRCSEPVRRARELLSGRSVRLVSGSWLDTVPPVPWWTDRRRSGGPLVEQAVHVLDTARVLVGEVTQVHAASAAPCRAARARMDRWTRRRPPCCGSPAAQSAPWPPPACSTGSIAPGWRSSPTGWWSGSARTGWRCVTVPGCGAASSTPGRPGWRPTAPSSTPCAGGRSTPRAPRPTTPRRCARHRLACALARSAAAGRPEQVR